MGISDVDLCTVDLDWFSVDRSGNIAHFMSGGQGLIRNSNRVSRAELDSLLEYFSTLPDNHSEIRLDSLARGNTEGMPKAKGLSDWAKRRYKAFLESVDRDGRRGIFVYDAMIASIIPVPYQRFVAPTRPLKLGEIPENVATIVRRMAMPEVCFGQDKIIDVRFCGNNDFPGSDEGPVESA